MTATELKLTTARRDLHRAAVNGDRVRIRGVVAAVGDGYSGTYRNVWLKITMGSAAIRLTASPSSPLGTMVVGSTLEVAVRLTGIVDLTQDLYYGERAKLLRAAPPA